MRIYNKSQEITLDEIASKIAITQKLIDKHSKSIQALELTYQAYDIPEIKDNSDIGKMAIIENDLAEHRVYETALKQYKEQLKKDYKKALDMSAAGSKNAL